MDIPSTITVQDYILQGWHGRTDAVVRCKGYYVKEVHRLDHRVFRVEVDTTLGQAIRRKGDDKLSVYPAGIGIPRYIPDYCSFTLAYEFFNELRYINRIQSELEREVTLIAACCRGGVHTLTPWTWSQPSDHWATVQGDEACKRLHAFPKLIPGDRKVEYLDLLALLRRLSDLQIAEPAK